MSTWSAMARPPSATIVSAWRCAAARSMSATATAAPSRASARAQAAPMPPPAPVTSATLPVTRPDPFMPCSSQCRVETAVDRDVLAAHIAEQVAAQGDDGAADVLARRPHAGEREQLHVHVADGRVLREEDLGRLGGRRGLDAVDGDAARSPFAR